MLTSVTGRLRGLVWATTLLLLAGCSPPLRQYIHEPAWDATEAQPRINVDECRKYEPTLEWGEGTVGRTYGIVATDIHAEDPALCDIKRRLKGNSVGDGEIVTVRGTHPGHCKVHFVYAHPVTKQSIDQTIELEISPEPTPPLSDPIYEQFDRCEPDWPWKYRKRAD